jgi:hypothetical protein
MERRLFGRELPLRALWAVEGELRRLVVRQVRQVRLPMLAIGWPPYSTTLSALRDRTTFSAAIFTSW